MATLSEEDRLTAFCAQFTPLAMESALENGTHPDELFINYWWCSTEHLIHWAVKTFVTPIIITGGSIGNMFAFALLTRKPLQQCSVCFFLRMYAVVNTVVLFVGCGLDWVSYITQTMHVANQADWVCRLWKFAFNVINYANGWLVVAMTMDRFVHMWYPRRAHQLCSVFMAKLISVVIFIGLVVISIHAMWTYALTMHGCIIETSEDAHAFTTIAWPMVSAIFYSYLPVVLTLTLIVFLLLGLVHPGGRSASIADRGALQQSLTVTVVTVSATYLLLYLPTIIVNIFMYSLAEFSRHIVLRARLFLLQELCQTLACLNNAMSFLLYFALVPALRHELAAVLQLFRKRQHHNDATEPLELSATTTTVVDINGGDMVKMDKDTVVTLL